MKVFLALWQYDKYSGIINTLSIHRTRKGALATLKKHKKSEQELWQSTEMIKDMRWKVQERALKD